MKSMLFVLSLAFTATVYAGPFFARGEYISTNTKDWPVGLKINRNGFIQSAFPITIPQGVRVAISFPNPLYWNPETEAFATIGWFAVQMVGPGVSAICQYPVRLESTFYNGGYEADVTLVFAQRYFFKNGACTHEGEAETFHIFRRVKN